MWLRKILLLLFIWNGQKMFKYVADYKRIKLIFKNNFFFCRNSYDNDVEEWNSIGLESKKMVAFRVTFSNFFFFFAFDEAE